MLVSIDPGKSGAYAKFSYDGQLVETLKVKVPPKQRLFGSTECALLEYFLQDVTIVVMESFLDHGLKKQSSIATNTTACNHGIQQGVIRTANNAMRLEIVEPKVWKRQMGLIRKDKKESCVLATKLVGKQWLRKPRMKVDNVDIAEAILIGIAWGREELQWTI